MSSLIMTGVDNMDKFTQLKGFNTPPKPKSLLGRHRQLSPTANIRVSPLCLGAMNFGEAYKQKMGECTKEQSFEILDTFVSLGGNFIDTASSYHAGESETWVGEWMKARSNRDQMVIATKFSSPGLLHVENAIQSNWGGNGSKSLRVSLETSLKRLQVEYVDILYVHWWDFATSIPELMQNLNDLVSAGKALYLGISDTPAWVVTKANQYARDHALRQFVVYQGMWNASMRDFERDIVPMVRDEGMGICAYGTLGQGRFQTKEGFAEREKHNPGRKKAPSELEKKISGTLEAIAKKKDTEVTSVAQAYILQKAPYVFPLVGCRTLGHLKGNVAALEVYLSEEEMAEIEAASPFDPGFPHTFISGSLIFGGEPWGGYQASDNWQTHLLGHFDWVENPKPIKPARK